MFRIRHAPRCPQAFLCPAEGLPAAPSFTDAASSPLMSFDRPPKKAVTGSSAAWRTISRLFGSSAGVQTDSGLPRLRPFRSPALVRRRFSASSRHRIALPSRAEKRMTPEAPFPGAGSCSFTIKKHLLDNDERIRSLSSKRRFSGKTVYIAPSEHILFRSFRVLSIPDVRSSFRKNASARACP